jgi:hypothetical protein
MGLARARYARREDAAAGQAEGGDCAHLEDAGTDAVAMRWALIIGGLALAGLSLSADQLGIGEGTAIGYKQITGTIVGGVIVIIGLARSFRR